MPKGYYPRKPAIERFWSKVDKNGENGCWIWQGGCNTTGLPYGRFSPTHSLRVSAHRYAWELKHGPIPEGVILCHHCDNARCVNTDHLFPGDNLMNAQDRDRKGRGAKGEKHWKAKLTQSQVDEIRRRWADGGISQPQLAREFGVIDNTIYKIVHHKLWG